MMEELGLAPKTDDWAQAKMDKKDLQKLIVRGEREQEDGQWSTGLGFGDERYEKHFSSSISTHPSLDVMTGRS